MIESDNVVNAEALLARANSLANRDTLEGHRHQAVMRAITEAQVYATLAVAEQFAQLVLLATPATP